MQAHRCRITTHRRACCNNHQTKKSRSQQPEGIAVQIETPREHTPRANLNNQEADQGRANSQMANKSRSQQQESKADRGNQKTKVRGRSKQTKRKQSNTDRGNQKTKVRGRWKQPRGRSGKIATTKGQFRPDRNNRKSTMAIRDNTDQIKSWPEITSLLCRSPGRTMPASPRSA